MLKYLYVPEKKDLYDYIEFAVQNNFNQVIHGESEIIKDLIINKDEVQEIKIPEYREILNSNLVFKENEPFKLTIIDEFVEQNKYSISNIEVYRLDDLDLNKKDFILQKEMKKISNYIYEVEITLDIYGEYLFQIFYEVDKTSRAIGESVLIEDSIIIYKEYKEEGSASDRFFFD